MQSVLAKVFVAIVIGGFGLTALAQAQPPAEVSTPQPETATAVGPVGTPLESLPGTGTPDVGPATAAPDSLPSAAIEPARPGVVYVPFKSLWQVFEREASSVVMSYSEYLRLVAQSVPRLDPGQLPVDAVITSASYQATVDKDLASIAVTWEVTVLKEGWVEIPVRLGEAAVGKLSAATGRAMLRSVGPGAYMLLLHDAGTHVVTLELATRIRTSPEGRSLELEVPPVAVTTFALTVPDPDQVIEVRPRLLSQPSESPAGQTRAVASVGGTDRIIASWRATAGSTPEMELLTSVTGATLISVEDGLVHADAWLNYEILRGQLSTFRVAIPLGDRVLDVTASSQLKDWNVSEVDGRQVLVAELLAPATGKLTVEVHTERALPEGSFPVIGSVDQLVTGIHPLDVLREGGFLAVRSGADLTLNVEELSGLARVDEGEVDERIRRPAAMYYRYYSPAVKLVLMARPVTPRVTVAHQARVIFTDDQLRTRSQLQYLVERAGLFELSVLVPEGLAIESVECPQLKQFDLSADKTRLTITLLEKTSGAIGVTIVGSMPYDSSVKTELGSVPLFEPLNLELENGTVQIYAPEAFDAVTNVSDVVGAQPDPAPVDAGVPNARLVSSWLFNRRPLKIPVKTVRKPTRLSATVASRLEVKPGQVHTSAKVEYLVEYAGLDTFRIDVPEAIADRVQISLASGSNLPVIKQQSRSPQAVDGWVTWTVVLQREVSGAVPLEVSFDLIPGSAEAGQAETTQVGLVRAKEPFDKPAEGTAGRSVPLSSVEGEVLLTAERSLTVNANATGEVEAIDVRELTRLPAEGFQAFRYYQQPVQIAVASTRFETQTVVETVASRGLVEVVFDREGVATVRARYKLKSSERQRLSLLLPEGIEPLGVMVDGRPIALEKQPQAVEPDGYDPFFINVARGTSADVPFTLGMVYRSNLKPPPFENYGGRLQIRLPQLGAVLQSPSVAVQELRVAVWVPKQYAIVGTGPMFSPQSTHTLRNLMFGQGLSLDTSDLDRWVGVEAAGVFDFPTQGRRYVYSALGNERRIELGWWHLPLYTAVVSGALVLIALILRRTSWDNKLTLLVLVAFGATVYSLREFDVVWHGLAVSLYGFVALGIIWVLSMLLGLRPVAAGASGSGGSITPPQIPFPATVMPPPGVFDTQTRSYTEPRPATPPAAPVPPVAVENLPGSGPVVNPDASDEASNRPTS